MNKQEIIQSVKLLPRDQQLDLAMELWDMVDAAEDEVTLTDTQKAELDRRIEAYHQNPQEARPWQQVKLEILKEIRQA